VCLQLACQSWLNDDSDNNGYSLTLLFCWKLLPCRAGGEKSSNFGEVLFGFFGFGFCMMTLNFLRHFLGLVLQSNELKCFCYHADVSLLSWFI